MSAAPHAVGLEQKLGMAVGFMRKHGVQHLPVLHGGEIVGILSARDVVMLEDAERVGFGELTVEDAMTSEPYTVPSTTPLHEVVATMAEHGLGSTLVQDGRELQGIFTATDAVAALAKLLQP